MSVEIEELKGKLLTNVESDSDEIIFTCNDGSKYKMHHHSDCCESVSIEDIEGDLKDLVGSPITQAEEVSNEAFENEWESNFSGEGYSKENKEGDSYPESHTWTFYKLATVKGYVTIRWFGESNGYYSESVDISKADEKGLFSEW